jgi:hypothetical protein
MLKTPSIFAAPKNRKEDVLIEGKDMEIALLTTEQR